MKRAAKTKKNKRMAYFWIIRLALAAAVIIAAFTQMGMVYHTEETYVPVRVQSGDTVWHIASTAAAPGTDVRDKVDEIMNINHIRQSEDIYPGQVLQVPVENSRADTLQQALQKP